MGLPVIHHLVEKPIDWAWLSIHELGQLDLFCIITKKQDKECSRYIIFRPCIGNLMCWYYFLVLLQSLHFFGSSLVSSVVALMVIGSPYENALLFYDEIIARQIRGCSGLSNCRWDVIRNWKISFLDKNLLNYSSRHSLHKRWADKSFNRTQIRKKLYYLFGNEICLCFSRNILYMAITTKDLHWVRTCH